MFLINKFKTRTPSEHTELNRLREVNIGERGLTRYINLQFTEDNVGGAGVPGYLGSGHEMLTEYDGSLLTLTIFLRAVLKRFTIIF